MNRRSFLGLLVATPALILAKPKTLGFVGYPRVLSQAQAIRINSGYEPPFKREYVKRHLVGRKQLKIMLQTGDFKWPT